MEFHGANEHYDYRVLSESTYKNIVRDFHMRERFKDFGIYGDWYVYRTLVASPEHIEGVFSASERKVRVYRSLFDRCWDDAQKPPPTTQRAMTPAELFGEHDGPVSVGPDDSESARGDGSTPSDASSSGTGGDSKDEATETNMPSSNGEAGSHDHEAGVDARPDGKTPKSEQAEN